MNLVAYMPRIEHNAFLKKLGSELKILRKKKGFSHQELAYRSELEKSTIIRIEQGKLNPSATTLYKLSQGLEIPAKKIFEFLS